MTFREEIFDLLFAPLRTVCHDAFGFVVGKVHEFLLLEPLYRDAVVWPDLVAQHSTTVVYSDLAGLDERVSTPTGGIATLGEVLVDADEIA